MGRGGTGALPGAPLNLRDRPGHGGRHYGPDGRMLADASGWTVALLTILSWDGSMAQVPEGCPKTAGESPIKSVPIRRDGWAGETRRIP